MEFYELTIAVFGIPIHVIDIFGLAWFIASWFGYARYSDWQYSKRVNLMRTMDMMRMRWMQEMIRRENRVVDATLIANLLRTIAFFASTTIIILIGLVTVLGSQAQGMKLVSTVPFAAGVSPFMWEIKIMVLSSLFIYAFFKLTWSLRQYNYASILVGAAPAHTKPDAELEEYARRLGRLVSNAGRHFNMGLRAYYFGLAAASWFINATLFIALTTLIVWVVFRREFRSHAVNHIAGLETV